jgi:chorismate synthase
MATLDPRSDIDASTSRLTIRTLYSGADYDACVELQIATWGSSYREVVPPTMLKITKRVGGIVAGAFDAGGRMLGFVYGLTGIEDGRLIHWSHMLAVRADARDNGIGRQLKEFQRRTLLASGVELMYWTFDPLVARNAHLNLNALGAEVHEFVPDMYGDTGSDLHVLATDRFVVAWPLSAGTARPISYMASEEIERAPFVNTDARGAPVRVQTLPDETTLRVEIPCDIDRVLATSPDLATAWSESVRHALLTSMQHGYRVCAFARDADTSRCYYTLQLARGG